MPNRLYYAALKKTMEEQFPTINKERHMHNNMFYSEQPFQIDSETIHQYVDEAIEQKYVSLNHQSFYIADLSKNHHTPFNTLVFQTSGAPLKTYETTTQVMNRFFSTKRVNYSWIQNLGRALRINQKCPYVIGPYYFAPDRGVSKKQANWIGMHYTTDSITLSPKKTLLKIDCIHELTVNLSQKTVTNMVDRVYSLSHAQYMMVKEWVDLFQEPLDTVPRNNLISRYANERKQGETIPSIISWTSHLSYLQAREMLIEILEEGDPYLDDLNKKFPPDENF